MNGALYSHPAFTPARCSTGRGVKSRDRPVSAARCCVACKARKHGLITHRTYVAASKRTHAASAQANADARGSARSKQEHTATAEAWVESRDGPLAQPRGGGHGAATWHASGQRAASHASAPSRPNRCAGLLRDTARLQYVRTMRRPPACHTRGARRPGGREWALWGGACVERGVRTYSSERRTTANHRGHECARERSGGSARRTCQEAQSRGARVRRRRDGPGAALSCGAGARALIFTLGGGCKPTVGSLGRRRGLAAGALLARHQREGGMAIKSRLGAVGAWGGRCGRRAGAPPGRAAGI